MGKRYRGPKKKHKNKRQSITHTITELSDWVQSNRDRHLRNENLHDPSTTKFHRKFSNATQKDINSISEEVFGGRYFCVGDKLADDILHSD